MGCIYGKKIKQLQKKVKTLEESGGQGGDLAKVATTGDYNDLENLPTIPTPTAVKGDAESSYRTGNVNITPANIGLGNVGNFKAVSTAANQGLTDTEKSNARANIGAGTSSFSGNYNDLTNKPTIPALPGDDAARANWGGSWRMPTIDESQAFGYAVNTAWTADYQGSGVSGLVCTDKTDSSKVLFFPACGNCENGSVENVGDYGYYLSSSLLINNRQYACTFYFYSSSFYAGWDSGKYRFYGCTVRPVLDGTNANGHEYVEIGGLKWATMNVGATGITDYGLYFQWGDTQGYTASQVGSGTGQKYFGWADYKYGNGTSSPGTKGMTKYNSTDGLTTLELPNEYLHKVSVTGNYNDLSNKPTIPTVYNWAQAQNKPSYNYSEISGTPTIPDTTGMVTSSTSGLKIEVVAALPASPDANTIYIVQ